MPVIHLEKSRGNPLDQALLNQAIAFFNAASRSAADIQLTPLVSNSPMTPAVVCYAFAAELYLKLLHVIASGEAPRGHWLDELFAALPPEFKAALAAEYKGKLDHDIAAMGQAFVEWRYEHEHELLTINPHALAAVSVACHKIVRKRRPHLKVLGENYALGRDT